MKRNRKVHEQPTVCFMIVEYFHAFPLKSQTDVTINITKLRHSLINMAHSKNMLTLKRIP